MDEDLALVATLLPAGDDDVLVFPLESWDSEDDVVATLAGFKERWVAQVPLDVADAVEKDCGAVLVREDIDYILVMKVDWDETLHPRSPEGTGRWVEASGGSSRVAPRTPEQRDTEVSGLSTFGSDELSVPKDEFAAYVVTSRDVAEALPPEVKPAIRFVTDDDNSWKIRAVQTNSERAKELSPAERAKIETHINTLHEATAFAEAMAPASPVTLYRGMALFDDEPDHAELLDKIFDRHQKVPMNAFASWSADPTVAKRFSLGVQGKVRMLHRMAMRGEPGGVFREDQKFRRVVFVTKSRSGVPVANISRFKDQSETLLPPSSYRVTGVRRALDSTRDILFVELEEHVTTQKADFDESLHPRDDHGRFAGGTGASAAAGAKAVAIPKMSRADIDRASQAVPKLSDADLRARKMDSPLHRRHAEMVDEELSDADRKSMKHWSSEGYTAIRAVLSGEPVPPGFTKKTAEANAKALVDNVAAAEAITKAANLPEKRLYRGMALPRSETELMSQLMTPGATVALKGPSSWSANPLVAKTFAKAGQTRVRPVILHVKTRAGLSMPASIKPKYAYEMETVMLPVSYRVVKHEMLQEANGKDSALFVTLEEINEAVSKAEWDESRHPRDPNGRFGTGGGHGASAAEKPTYEGKVGRTRYDVGPAVDDKLGTPGLSAALCDAWSNNLQSGIGGEISEAALRAGLAHGIPLERAGVDIYSMDETRATVPSIEPLIVEGMAGSKNAKFKVMDGNVYPPRTRTLDGSKKVATVDDWVVQTHAATQVALEAHGLPPVLMRGIRGELAEKLVAGGPGFEYADRALASYTAEPAAAHTYAGSAGVIVRYENAEPRNVLLTSQTHRNVGISEHVMFGQRMRVTKVTEEDFAGQFGTFRSKVAYVRAIDAGVSKAEGDNRFVGDASEIQFDGDPGYAEVRERIRREEAERKRLAAEWRRTKPDEAEAEKQAGNDPVTKSDACLRVAMAALPACGEETFVIERDFWRSDDDVAATLEGISGAWFMEVPNPDLLSEVAKHAQTVLVSPLAPGVVFASSELIQAGEQIQILAKDFDESKHPRDANGRFASGDLGTFSARRDAIQGLDKVTRKEFDPRSREDIARETGARTDAANKISETSLSESERGALQFYTMAGYREITALYEPASGEAVSEYAREARDHLVAAIAKAEDRDDAVPVRMYRGISLSGENQEFIDKLLVGGEVSLRGLTSWSLKPDVSERHMFKGPQNEALPVLLTMVSKRGLPIADRDHAVADRREHEVLHAPKVVRVRSVKNIVRGDDEHFATLVELEEQDDVAKALSQIRIAKTGEERYVLGVVLEPDTVDSQGDFYSAEDVRKAAHSYMEHHTQLGLQHREIVTGKLKILESFVAPVDFQIEDQTVRQGSWLMGIRVVDDGLWSQTKKGAFTGFSIGGSAYRKPEVYRSLPSKMELEKFDESLIHRDDHGRFASGPGGGSASAPAAAVRTDKPVKERKAPKERKPRKEKEPAKEVEPVVPAKALTPEQERAARQTVDHWLPALAKKYGDGTGFAIAMGKAAMHRGFDVPMETAKATLNQLRDAGVRVPSTMWLADVQKWARTNLGTEFKTFGEALEYVETKRPLVETKNRAAIISLKAMAALVGHVHAIEQQKRTEPINIGAVKMRWVTSVAAPISEQTAGYVITNASNLFQKMTGANVKHPEASNHDVVIEPRPNGTYRGAYFKPQWGEKGVINIGTGSDATVVHEWGHALEEMNPKLAMRAQMFLMMRTGNDVPQRLKDLSPVSDYEPNEVAKPDRFYEPYMGKIYAGGATEITSMLVQQLVVSGGLEQIAERDEESMHFLFGQLRGDLADEEEAALKRLPQKEKPAGRKRSGPYGTSPYGKKRRSSK